MGRHRLRPGDRVLVDIVRLDDRGRGCGRAHALEVTVDHAYPGERIDTELTWVDRRGTRAFGRIARVVQADPARRAPGCVHHPRDLEGGGECKGCPLLSLGVERQRELKTARIADEFGLRVEAVIGGADRGYRWSAKRVVGGIPGALVLGSRVARPGKLPGPDTPIVADMRRCQVDHPAIVETAAELVDVANTLGIEPWRTAANEAPSGDLRYAWFKTDGVDVLVTLITGARRSRAHELAAALRRPAGVAWSVQSDVGNAIRGDAPRLLTGTDTLSLSFAGERVEVGALGFLQPNPEIAALAYQDLTRLPDTDEPRRLAYDLYAGAGITTRRLARCFETVVPCEVYPESAQALGVQPMTTASFLRDRLAEPAPDLVVANPPRGGMGPEVCELLRRMGPPQLRIMSCSAETLAADLNRLVAERGAPAEGGARYHVTRMCAYDTLPHTSHLELVAWLRRDPAA